MVHFPLLQVFSWAVLQIKPSAYLVSTPEPTSHTKPPEFWLWLCESRLLSSEFDPCLAKFTASKIRGFRFFAYCSLLTWAKAGGFAGGILNTCNSWGYNRSPNNPVKINVQHYDAFAICFSVSVSFINSSCKQRIFFKCGETERTCNGGYHIAPAGDGLFSMGWSPMAKSRSWQHRF